MLHISLTKYECVSISFESHFVVVLDAIFKYLFTISTSGMLCEIGFSMRNQNKNGVKDTRIFCKNKMQVGL